jgi:hypothetical protein
MFGFVICKLLFSKKERIYHKPYNDEKKHDKLTVVNIQIPVDDKEPMDEKDITVQDKNKKEYKYKKHLCLMTPAERSFYGVLRKVVSVIF